MNITSKNAINVFTTTTLGNHFPPEYCFIIDTDRLSERFWLVTVLGSTLSAISIIENLFLLVLFARSRQHRNSPSFYLLILALSDIFISGTYIMIMSVKVLYQYAEWVALKRIWIIYLVPMMTMSHVAITTSSFLIVFATAERFFAVISYRNVEFLQNNRKLIALLAIIIGLVTKSTLLFEIKAVYNPECTGTLNEYKLELTDLVIHNAHYKLWRFWFRNIVTILFPFFILMYLNARIVNQLRENVNIGENIADNMKQRKARIRAATRTLVLVVCTYLLANMLNVIITIWEHTDATSLFTGKKVIFILDYSFFSFLDFYIISVDAVSLLTIVACALRLPIYASCQPVLRREMIIMIKRLLKNQELEERQIPLLEKNIGA
ncbi:unnamed protein product [Dracunculus medinensis]|uniref:G_PROTEIN_RECEP_F1_2 domain-containing protein n=1 Tax=Dracunculus medinensis TaxID=318479 RepID=A0A0N4UQ74_DRAME|nr:unnamed protein product [Dracunculus medinensis]